MRSPTRLLSDEHRVILGGLDVLEGGAARLARNDALPDGWWEAMIEWLRAFADRNHHAKEEQSLFPAMVKAGVPSEGGPIAVMLEEHRQGRGFIKKMAEGAEAERPGAARRYIRLLREHIDKEDNILFPMADSVLDDAALAAVSRDFEMVEAEQGRTASIDWARQEVERLASVLG
jgi:hemerythrin-like domain-containing protein